jgi:hypothetical protein
METVDLAVTGPITAAWLVQKTGMPFVACPTNRHGLSDNRHNPRLRVIARPAVPRRESACSERDGAEIAINIGLENKK